MKMYSKSSKKTEKRIGILGGTFNPIHLGHLNLARFAARKLSLDRVIFVPSHIPPHKKIEDNVKPSDRLNMVRGAIKKEKEFSLSLYEIKRLKKSYSIATLKYFKKKFGPKTKLFFIIGADSLIGIYFWKHIKKALNLAQFIVVGRPGYSLKNCPRNIVKIDMRKLDISSTKIRTLIKKGKSIRGLVPIIVDRYIKKKKLYSC